MDIPYDYKLNFEDELIQVVEETEDFAKLKFIEKKENIIFVGSPGVFCDQVIANAILDRLLHYSHVIHIVGPSYRTKGILEVLEE